MKKYFTKENSIKLLYIFAGIIIFIILFNMIIMPWYVSADEVKVPKVLGLSEEQAKQMLEDNDLEAVRGGERFDERYPKGSIIFQKPAPGAVVKEGRRVFLFVSSGIPTIKIPSLKGKYLRDAKLTLERLDLLLGDTSKIESQSPAGTVVDQQYYEGTQVSKGTKVNLVLSAGERAGRIKIPDLLGKSLSEAEKILQDSKLNLGRVNYQPSFSLLPNTVIDQYPAKDNLVEEGSSVDLFVTKNVSTSEEAEGENK